MDINNNTAISNQIANSISKLHLNTTKKVKDFQLNSEFQPEKNNEAIKKEDISLINEQKVEEEMKKTGTNKINVEEIQKYASSMGENLSIDDINYGLMYGRSVIADFSI